MKKYLFGLGAMLVGAGLMFVFTHTEVSAKPFDKKQDCILIGSEGEIRFSYCKVEELTCVMYVNAVSCVKAD